MHVQENKRQWTTLENVIKQTGYPLLTCITVMMIIKAIYMPRSAKTICIFYTHKLRNYYSTEY